MMIFDIALGIFLFLSPIIILLGQNARMNGAVMALQFYQFKSLSLMNNIIQLQFFQYGILLLFIIALTQKPIRNFQDKYVAWFLGLCALSVVLHPKTISAIIPVFLGVLLYYLAVTYTKNIKTLLYVIVSVSALNTLFAILQFFDIHLIYNSVGGIKGLMCISTHLGIYQALALPICYTINPFLAIIPLVGLILSKSITPFVALLAGLLYLWFPYKKKIFLNLAPIGLSALLGIFIVVVVGNYQFVFYKLSLKFGLWFVILKEIFKNPLGYGLNTFSELSSKIYSKAGHWEWIYNEYLAIAFYIGILAWFIMGLFLIDRFQGIRIGIERAIATSCLIIAVICLGQPAMHFARLTGTIIPMFAFLEILKRKESDENKICGR